MADSAVELARELIRVDTINPPGREERLAAPLAGRLQAAGFDVVAHELAPGRTSLVARLPGRDGGPALCLTAHLDTVPLGGASWEHEPLGGEIDGDRLYGRGSSDMKAGLAAIVTAAERVARDRRGARGLELVLCAGEETGCDGALALTRSGLLGEAGAVLVAEPTSNHPCVAHKGVVWLRASTEGSTAHGSMPHLGRNAIYPLARALGALEELTFDVPAHDLLGEPTLNLGTIAGGLNINSVPDRATAGIDVRTVPGLGGDDVQRAVAGALGPDVRVETQLALDAIDTDAADPWVQQVFAVMEPLIGERPQPRGLAYFTDAAALTPAYGRPPTIVCGPGDAEQAHRTDESCSVARIEAAAEGFYEIARAWCRG
jgi:succinyl-diaminopimelate desuccinylase